MSTAAIASSTVLDWSERGLMPDSLIRAGIRRLCHQRLNDINAGDVEKSVRDLQAFVESMNRSEIAPIPQIANEQHYEIPPEFFHEVLGKHAKYSCCFWNDETDNLNQAESSALEITCRRAEIEDGMTILDLGCGWGSLSLWIAEHYPNCQVHSVSNSRLQGDHIRFLARERGLKNIQIITRDMNDFFPDGKYDRIVSVEMFEHMRNYRKLFKRISQWLHEEGKFFMHIFCHRDVAYEFLDEGPSDWMGRHFFSGGIMPSDDLPFWFQEDLKLLKKYRWNGKHYEQTANSWLTNMDDRRLAVLPILAQTYGSDNADRWFQRWRIFFMACAELFAFNDGNEWFVSHYLFGLSKS